MTTVMVCPACGGMVRAYEDGDGGYTYTCVCGYRSMIPSKAQIARWEEEDRLAREREWAEEIARGWGRECDGEVDRWRTTSSTASATAT